ncbi:MAG: Mth938-like domain-containing protein [Acidobacteriota bacterium]
MKISSYSFGKIVFQGKSYSSDLIIYPDRVDDLWWREEGHLLTLMDIEEVLKANPEIIVVGTGAFGMMKVDPALKEILFNRGIELIAERTKEACDVFNRYLKKGNKVIGMFHLTC